MPPSNLTHASSRAITRPRSPKCGTIMMLARIEPHTPGYHMRTFECRPAIIRKARSCISRRWLRCRRGRDDVHTSRRSLATWKGHIRVSRRAGHLFRSQRRRLDSQIKPELASAAAQEVQGGPETIDRRGTRRERCQYLRCHSQSRFQKMGQ
jgi:hypothetical protein